MFIFAELNTVQISCMNIIILRYAGQHV